MSRLNRQGGLTTRVIMLLWSCLAFKVNEVNVFSYSPVFDVSPDGPALGGYFMGCSRFLLKFF